MHEKLAFIVIQWTLFIEQRPRYFAISSFSNCLFVTKISQGNLNPVSTPTQTLNFYTPVGGREHSKGLLAN